MIPFKKIKNYKRKELKLNSKEAVKFLSDYSNNEAQRTIKDDRVDEYLDHIKQGTFFPSQIVIGIYKIGRTSYIVILDGHHRLQSIVKAETEDKIELDLLEIILEDKYEVKFYYQMFDNKRNLRSLTDLLKFKLSYSDLHGKWKRPETLARALLYAGGLWFTKSGYKTVIPNHVKISKEEFLSDALNVELWHDALTWVDEKINYIYSQKHGARLYSNGFGGVKAIGTMLESLVRCHNNSTKQRKVKKFWEEVISEVIKGHAVNGDDTCGLITGLMDKAHILRNQDRNKTTAMVAPYFYLYYHACQAWIQGTRANRLGKCTPSKLPLIKKEDVLKECFGGGRNILQINPYYNASVRNLM